jgi:hypothetical protein
MRRLYTAALVVFAGMAAAAPEDLAKEMAGAARVEKILRAQGLAPGKQAPPDEYGDFGLSVGGTAEKPEFTNTRCVPPMYDSPSFSGKRFHYVAKNHGEWGGEFMVREGDGPERPLLEENVIFLIPDGADLYVLSGLDHGMDNGGVHVVRDFDSNPQMVSVSRLPGTPLAYTRGDGMHGELLVVSKLAVTRVRTNSVPESLEVLMARHARLPGANSVLSIGRSQILIGLCGGVAQVQLPWYVRVPGAERDIPVVTYWTRH